MSFDASFYKFMVCCVCKNSTGQRTKHCGKCRVAGYCSKDHQLEDWTSHRALCKIIARENHYLEYNVTNSDQLQKYVQRRVSLWQIKLGRKLTRAEYQMCMFPKVCAICYKRESLFHCPDCLSEFYCSEEHQAEHKESHKIFCGHLKLSLDMDCYFYHNPSINDFKIKHINEGLRSIPETLEGLIETQLATNDLSYINNCDQILSGLSILFALEQSGLVLNRKIVAKSSLDLHLVGATTFELSLNWTLILELFFHWLENLEIVHLLFVGPELDLTLQFSLSELKKQFCPTCQNRPNLLIKEAEFKRDLYQDKYFEKPDLIVAFNSGLHEFHKSPNDPWKDSISCLIAREDIPLLLTAYTKDEIESDLDRLKEVEDISLIYGPTKNAFANRRPLVDWASKENPIYFINNFAAIVKRTL